MEAEGKSVVCNDVRVDLVLGSFLKKTRVIAQSKDCIAIPSCVQDPMRVASFPDWNDLPENIIKPNFVDDIKSPETVGSVVQRPQFVARFQVDSRLGDLRP